MVVDSETSNLLPRLEDDNKPTYHHQQQHEHEHEQRGHRSTLSTASFVPEFVVEVITDAQEAAQEVARDILTFEELDPEQVRRQAVEAVAAVAAAAEASNTALTEDWNPLEEQREWVEQYMHPDDPMDPFAPSETTTSGHHHSQTHDHHHHHEKLGILPLAIIVFYNVSGGPFGIETSVRAGGNFFALLGFLIMPFIWSVQEALMTAELGTTYPEASGGVAWVEEAFGPTAGWMSGYLGWIAGATDNAIYMPLFLDYLLSSTRMQQQDQPLEDLHPILRFSFLTGASLLLGYINWKGLPLVGKMSTWICLVAMSPFLIMILIGGPQVEPSRWFQLPNRDDIDEVVDATDDNIYGGFFPDAQGMGVLWRPFLNNLFWNLNSFDAAGSFAGEVENIVVTTSSGATTNTPLFPRAVGLGVVLVVAGYFFPLLIAVGATDFDQAQWTDGFLTQVVTEIGGPWLGAWTVFAAAISNIALFQAELSADAFQLMGMADRGHVPKVFSRRSPHGTPTSGILLGVGVIIVMGTSNFDQLVEMLNFNYALSLLMEYCAFIKLRISQPEKERPYRVPLGTVGCILLLTPTFLVTFLVLGLATYSTYAFVLGTNIVGLIVFYGKVRSDRLKDAMETEDEQDGKGSIVTEPTALESTLEE